MSGMTGDEIYENFTTGAGPDGLIGGADMVRDVASGYEARATQIRALMSRMEAAWQGQASGAALRGAGPLAIEHDLSATALATAQDLTNRQAGSFSEARSRVVPVPPKPEPVNPMVILTNPNAVVELERQVDEYNNAAQHNVDVMNGYSGASEYNTTNLPHSYGKLSLDEAGVDIGSPGTTIASSDFGGGGDRGGTGGGPRIAPLGTGPDSSSSPSNGPDRASSDGRPSGNSGSGVTPGGVVPGASSPGGVSPGGVSPGGISPGGVSPGTTTPETFLPSPGGQNGLSADPNPGRLSGSPIPGGVPAVGSTPDPAFGSLRSGPGGGVPGGLPGTGGPLGGGGGGLRGVGGGPVAGGPGAGAGAGETGSASRSGPGSVLGAGRANAGASGFPVGAAGRGRDEEDHEHRRPEWLEGGDPDDLFDTDELTAPPTIGAEDD
ncbi:PPE domain-containing protein [Actinophytocola xanthii]|uniref:PPE domain-containing protein n=1 Tax=Actinophytocola xanthii TaxID=1912961 RepID=A0A1Q8CRT7_9PSEU|nr:PPE domain-containing protein [Actinophytocola xanthii]OLF17081.1 hypothetical protein BU204_13395 [Actinophytocola xanthii]